LLVTSSDPSRVGTIRAARSAAASTAHHGSFRGPIWSAEASLRFPIRVHRKAEAPALEISHRAAPYGNGRVMHPGRRDGILAGRQVRQTHPSDVDNHHHSSPNAALIVLAVSP
jgi:hypothetical protein